MGVGGAPINYMGVASNYTNLITSDQSINQFDAGDNWYWNSGRFPALAPSPWATLVARMAQHQTQKKIFAFAVGIVYHSVKFTLLLLSALSQNSHTNSKHWIKELSHHWVYMAVYMCHSVLFLIFGQSRLYSRPNWTWAHICQNFENAWLFMVLK